MLYETKQAEISKELQELNGRLEILTKSKEYLKGYSDCQKEYEEKLRWIPVIHKKYGFISDETIELMKKSFPFILKYNTGFLELIESESEIVDSFGAVEFRSVFL